MGPGWFGRTMGARKELVKMVRRMRWGFVSNKDGRSAGVVGGGQADRNGDLTGEVEMWEHEVEVEELVERLETDVDKGLSTTEAAERLERDGMNRLSPAEVVPWWRKLLKQFTNFFAVLMEVAAVLCLISFVIEPDEKDNLVLGIVLLAVVGVTGTFTFLQEYKSEKTMEKFTNYLPPVTLVCREGRTVEVDASMLVVGDVVHVHAGDKVPADLRLVSVSKLKVDNSSLTGESEPIERSIFSSHPNPLETANLMFFGTLAVEGSGKGIVVRTGDDTVLGRIAALAVSAGQNQTTLELEIHHFIVLISIIALFIGIGFFIIDLLRGTRFLDSIIFCIGIVVANVPEGLLATVTVSLTLTAKRMAKKNVLVKKLECVETLGSTTTICSDKTGTLTQNRMTVVHVAYGGKIYTTKTITTAATFDEDDPVFRQLLLGGCLCSRAVFDVTDMTAWPDIPIDERKVNGDASESGILKFAQKLVPVKQVRERNPTLCVVPFDSATKVMVTVHELETDRDQTLLVMKGAPERVLDLCQKILTPRGVRDITREDIDDVNRCLDDLMSNGERVLGFAERLLPPEYTSAHDFRPEDPDFVDSFASDDLCFVGLMSLMDPPRESVPYAVKVCQDAGIQVIMVTGDHPKTAKTIAKKVNIITKPTREDLAKQRGVPVSEVDPVEAQAIVVPGSDIRELMEEEWDKILSKEQIVFARTSPQQKLLIVENCQRLGKIVAVTGDGVNDAPALKKANIGVAMGISGSDVSKEASDMVLLDDNFSSIVSGIEEGRLIFDNLKKSIAYTLTSNIPALAPFLFTSILNIPLPLTTILILCIDLGTDMLPAISLAYERAERDIMKRQPRNAKRDHLVNRRLVSFAYLHIGLLQAATGLFAYLIVFNDFGIAPNAVIGMDPRDNFASELIDQQRWLYTEQKDLKSAAYETGWFRNGSPFDVYFNDTARDGFIVQTKFIFEGLPSNADPPPSGGVFAGVPGVPSNAQFNNMVKIIGYETQIPPCLQFVCEVEGSLNVNNFACFEPESNSGPVYYNGINTGAVNDQSVGACFDLWDVERQRKMLAHAQCAYFIAVILMQWVDLLICKTRNLSLFQQGMKNKLLNIGLVEELALAALLVYVPIFNSIFNTAPLRFVHWLPSLPFALLEFVYDESRKGFMRLNDRKPNLIGQWLREYAYW